MPRQHWSVPLSVVETAATTWMADDTCDGLIGPLRRQTRLVTLASNKLQKRRREEPRGLTPNPQQRERSLTFTLSPQRRGVPPLTAPPLCSTPVPPRRCGPHERWSWQSRGTKICVMLWLLMPRWQILTAPGLRFKALNDDAGNVTNRYFSFSKSKCQL